MVVAEAVACGCPAVVSAETYAAWNQGREHFLVAEPTPTADAVHALLNSSAPLLDPTARAAISAYARTHWDWDQAAQSYVSLFESMAV